MPTHSIMSAAARPDTLVLAGPVCLYSAGAADGFEWWRPCYLALHSTPPHFVVSPSMTGPALFSVLLGGGAVVAVRAHRSIDHKYIFVCLMAGRRRVRLRSGA